MKSETVVSASLRPVSTVTYATERRTTADRQTEVDSAFVTLMLGAHTRSCTLYLVLALSL